MRDWYSVWDEKNRAPDQVDCLVVLYDTQQKRCCYAIAKYYQIQDQGYWRVRGKRYRQYHLKVAAWTPLPGFPAIDYTTGYPILSEYTPVVFPPHLRAKPAEEPDYSDADVWD